MLLHKHYLGAAHSFEIVTPEDPTAGKYVRPDVTIIKTFYCNDLVNENDWQATWEGLKQDAEDLPGTPIVLKEDLEHPKFSVQDMYDRGTIFDFDIDEANKQIIVYARITDLSIVERIKSGELQYVSPALIPRGSEYLKTVRGVDVLSRTLPIHLAIVSNPAYGKEKAKISHICSGDGKECYHRLKMMTANVNKIIEREHELLDQGVPEDEVHKMLKKEFGNYYTSDGEGGDGTGGENSGIKSKLKIHNADDGISELEQIPFIKKMVASTAKIKSGIEKIHYGSAFHVFHGREGRWINIQEQDIFVARNQGIEAAMADQCGCTKFAAMDDPEIESWITVRGNHIPIKKNQTKEEAVEEFLKDKGDQHKPKQMSDDEIVAEMHKDHPSMPEKTVRKNLDIYRKINSKLEKTKNDLETSLKKELPGDPVVSGRVKEPKSGVAKVARKPKYADVSKLQDNVGMRAMYNDVTSVKEAMKVVREKYDIVEEDNYIDKPKFDGYRSYHAIIIDKETGVESELQVRTQRQNTFADWAHKFYKPEEDDLKAFVQTHEEMALKYQVDVGNYYSELDNGRKPKKPLCPKEILKLMMCL